MRSDKNGYKKTVTKVLLKFTVITFERDCYV